MEASSSSSLDVSWLCPEAIGTYDAVLLTYRVSYTEDSSTASPTTVDVRASVGMVTPDSCLVKTTVSSLKEGTTYSVTVRAMAGGNMGQQGVISADASTFGQGKGVGTICGVSSFSLFVTVFGKTNRLVRKINFLFIASSYLLRRAKMLPSKFESILHSVYK